VAQRTDGAPLSGMVYSDLIRVNPCSSAVRSSLLRSLCFLRLFPISCPDLGVFVALREIFGLNLVLMRPS
jgi:hypothetical protein